MTLADPVTNYAESEYQAEVNGNCPSISPECGGAAACSPGTTGGGQACTPCAAGTFKNESGSQPCTLCPTHQKSSEGSTECECDEEHTGRKCMVRRRPAPGPDDRFFQVQMELIANASHPMLSSDVEQRLLSEISEFLSLGSGENVTLQVTGSGAAAVSCGMHSTPTCGECPMGNGASWCNGDCLWIGGDCASEAECCVDPADAPHASGHNARRAASDSKHVNATAVISANFTEFSLRISERKVDLVEYLDGSCQVTSMDVTCGSGHEPGPASGCSPCGAGYFKQALDNSPCIRSRASLSPERAAETAAVVTAAVGAVIATAVGSAVGLHPPPRFCSWFAT